jgi:hypothetical protein
MKTVTVDGQQYSIAKLDAMKQFQVVRRLTPIAAALFKSVKMDGEANAANLEETGRNMLTDFLSNAGPFADALAGMTDEQVENIVYPCMAVVKRQQGPAWADIKVPGQNKLMFADIDGITLVKLTVEVLRDNLSNFFSGLQIAPPESTSPRA